MNPPHLLAGYRQLIDDYFLYLQRGELISSRGLCFTRMAEASEADEEELIAHCIVQYRRQRVVPVLVDWSATLAEAINQGTEFRQFFGQLWELQAAGASESEQQDYLNRLSSLMQKARDPEPADSPGVIIHHIGPVQEMSDAEMEQLSRLLAARMERALPVFIFFREDYSALLRHLQRASDIIWALDETSYAAEFYLAHPLGFGIVQAHNRRRQLTRPTDPPHN